MEQKIKKGLSNLLAVTITLLVMVLLSAGGYFYLNNNWSKEKAGLESNIKELSESVEKMRAEIVRNQTVEESKVSEKSSSYTTNNKDEQTDPFSIEALKNAYYSDSINDKAQMVDGTYIDVNNNNARVTLDTTKIAFHRDENGNINQAAVIVSSNDGGTGIFKRLVLFSKKGDIAQFIADAELGDRVQIESIAFTSLNRISLSLLDFGPDDPSCCPSQNITKIYEWISGTKLKLK